MNFSLPLDHRTARYSRTGENEVPREKVPRGLAKGAINSDLIVPLDALCGPHISASVIARCFATPLRVPDFCSRVGILSAGHLPDE